MTLNEGIKRAIDRQLESGKKEEGTRKKEIESLFSERSRVHINVHGKVQGVFFRDFVQKTAENLQLTGWVRNTTEGTVETIAEGDKKALEELVEKCQKGPRWATVTKADIKWEKYKGEFGSFDVR
ncbi:acylphosphatase [Candidatus Woesearchaeota archaeon]|nr:acylphosphatase [Candidatus Woesearchaeota archaeon]